MTFKTLMIVLICILAVGIATTTQLMAGQNSKTPPTTAAAEKPAANADADKSWKSRCQDMKDGETVTGKYCEAVQQLFVMQKDADPSTAQRVAEMAIGYPQGSGENAQGVLVLPLGILVQDKVTVEVDEDKLLTMKVRYCDAGGCYASFELDKGDVKKLRAGGELVVKTQAVTGQPVTIGLPLTGFGAAMDSISPKG